ncbi:MULTISPECIES: hypothetical protein [unclassified Beijerinckia]|uniref:hypothetical protein n=1 Tax=unclassified Beijerinckia TaxID=2638183 RepID=UPI00089836C6|nr:MULTISPECIES: hypothetical protein [unclassified Beijerinckia]MDH7799450.1 hypothetical protein [Beijerinckia sp. GAS462]SED50882.1 hypothetical protein SAMN05443249_5568 [Beijerinckia sp. 28-YEA-48]
MPRDADLFSTQLETVVPPLSEGTDRIEFWAKRTGRIIGLILLVVLTINLATGWFF